MAMISSMNPAMSSLNNAHTARQNTMLKIATGSNYPSAADNGAAYAILQRMNSNIGAIGQSVQNTQNATAMLKTAEGATSNTIGALTSIREQIVNAANGTNTDSDRAAIQQNINQLVQQIDDNARVNYNGINLLDGSNSGIMIAGLSGYQNVELGDMRSQALGLTDNQGNSTINLTNNDDIQNALERVGGAINFVQGVNDNLQASLDGGDILNYSLDEETTQGAQLQRLEYQAANYTTMQENEIDAASNIGDADIAEQITKLRSQQTQEQLALYATRIFNHNQANVLNLLK